MSVGRGEREREGEQQGECVSWSRVALLLSLLALL